MPSAMKDTWIRGWVSYSKLIGILQGNNHTYPPIGKDLSFTWRPGCEGTKSSTKVHILKFLLLKVTAVKIFAHGDLKNIFSKKKACFSDIWVHWSLNCKYDDLRHGSLSCNDEPQFLCIFGLFLLLYILSAEFPKRIPEYTPPWKRYLERLFS